MLNESPEPVTTTNRNVTIINPEDDTTADDESDKTLYVDLPSQNLPQNHDNIIVLAYGSLVHILQLPLHVQRHGVPSSPMGTMFASAPSKFPRSTSRTSHPSRQSPEEVLHVEHSQLRLCCGVACIIMLPCPCGQRKRSIPTGRFPVDASTVRMFSFVSGSRAAHLASFVVLHSVASFLNSLRWMDAVVRCFLPRSSPVAPR